MLQNVPHDYEKIWSLPNNLGVPNPENLVFITENNPKTILDLGAGSGRYSIYLQNLGYKVTAIESSIEGCKRIQEQNSDVKVVCADFLKYSTNDKFDCVLCIGLIEEFTDQETQLKILRKAQGLVAKKGRLCILTATFIGGRIPEERLDPSLLIQNFDTSKWKITDYTTNKSAEKNKNQLKYSDSNVIKKQRIIADLI